MRKIIFSLLLFSALSASSQNIDKVLQDIEQNNTSLKAYRHLNETQRIEARSGNVPENPEVEMMRGWKKGGDEKALEIDVAQGFDFPSAYVARRKAANAKIEQLGHEQNAYRQELLLEGKILCFNIIALRQELTILTDRVENTRRMAQAQVVALEKGEISILDKNLTDMELADLQNQHSLKAIELQTAEENLQNLNGGVAVDFAGADYPMTEEVLPQDVMWREYQERAPQLLVLMSEQKNAELSLKASRHEALPGFKVGYHFEQEGEDKLNGIVVGMTVPLWGSRRHIRQNKAQIEYAKAQLVSEQINMQSTLKELYARYKILQKTLSQLQGIADNQTSVENYLHQAFTAGELSEIDYFTELNKLYTVREQRIAVERDLHLVIAEINALNL